MNRTKQSKGWDEQSLAPPINGFDAGVLESSNEDVAHTLFAPLHYESGYAYPLIVWLHGRDCDERQLTRIMPLVSMRNYVAIAPRGLSVPDCGGFDWPQTPEEVAEAERRIAHCVRLAKKKLHVAAHRVFLAGFGSGGTMAFRVAMNQPHEYAGVLSLCGEFPKGASPLRNLTSARRISVFVAAGRDSLVFTPEHFCSDLRLLHAAGMNITLRQYPCGQEISPLMLSDLDRWVIEQITAPVGQPTESVVD
jgi:phospholipase/carboxylesterase